MRSHEKCVKHSAVRAHRHSRSNSVYRPCGHNLLRSDVINMQEPSQHALHVTTMINSQRPFMPSRTTQLHHQLCSLSHATADTHTHTHGAARYLNHLHLSLTVPPRPPPPPPNLPLSHSL